MEKIKHMASYNHKHLRSLIRHSQMVFEKLAIPSHNRLAYNKSPVQSIKIKTNLVSSLNVSRKHTGNGLRLCRVNKREDSIQQVIKDRIVNIRTCSYNTESPVCITQVNIPAPKICSDRSSGTASPKEQPKATDTQKKVLSVKKFRSCLLYTSPSPRDS